MARVIWSPSALQNLDSIAAYVERDSPAFSRLLVQRLFSRVEHGSEFPRSGRIVPEYGDPDIREFLVGNYRVVYRIRGDIVEVAAVVHAARLLPPEAPTGAGGT